MNILHIIESDGGSADFIYFLAKYLPENQHTILCGKRASLAFKKLSDQFAQDFPENIKLIFWENAEREVRPFLDLQAILSLIKFLKNTSFDVVHLHSSKAGFLGRIACKFLGISKVIYTTHAISFLRKDVSDFKIKIYKTLEKVASRCGGVSVCCSDSEREELLKQGIASIVIPNGTEVSNLQNKQESNKGSIIIGTIGRVTIQKNPALFNEIAIHFKHTTNVKFVWMGKGELEDLLNSENIEITGWLNKADLTARLKEVDIYISTALWEGMPLAVLEAMALGKPLLLSSCVGNTDLVKNNRNGQLFSNVSDAISKLGVLIENDQLRTELGSASYEICKNEFDIKLTAERYLSLYKSVAY